MLELSRKFKKVMPTGLLIIYVNLPHHIAV